MSAHSQIGYLVPLNGNLDEDNSTPKIPILLGSNVVGRNNFSLTDKRLSRKHVTINATADGSANVFVEGTNPVVIRCLDQRKKLLSHESSKIENGNVLELIPGHHIFKYVVASQANKLPPAKCKRPSIEGSEFNEGRLVTGKKTRQIVEDEAFDKNSQNNVTHNKPARESSPEAIRDFNIPTAKLPLTFRLLKVQGLPAWANTNAVSITDVIQGNILVAVLSNYMVDIDWLLSACPTLRKVPHVLVIHGEGDGTFEYMKRCKPANWVLHKPPLPISFGTHHSKAMVLVYRQGVRIIIHTANLIYVDWNNKSQGLWMQDFPWKDQSSSNTSGGFESDLIDYLSALKLPEFTANLPDLGSVNINSSFFRKFDYSGAAVRLIASVPGYHSGSNLMKWGHMKLRCVLQDCVFDKEFQKSPLVYQFSSLGSLDEKWMAELTSSMSSGVTEEKQPLGVGEPLIIWPTVEDVRCSLEGYAAGNAIPSPQKNVEKAFLKKYWAKWKASHTGRCRAMPHIKTFTRFSGQKLAWFLLTSANLSKAAWGALQKNNSQLMIRSYELGVLFLPSMGQVSEFSCTDNQNPPEEKCGTFKSSEERKKRTELVTLAWQGNSRVGESSQVIKLPVPYELPPPSYSPQDVPWSWDRRYQKKDVYGQVWPRQVQLYTNQS